MKTIQWQVFCINVTQTLIIPFVLYGREIWSLTEGRTHWGWERSHADRTFESRDRKVKAEWRKYIMNYRVGTFNSWAPRRIQRLRSQFAKWRNKSSESECSYNFYFYWVVISFTRLRSLSIFDWNKGVLIKCFLFSLPSWSQRLFGVKCV